MNIDRVMRIARNPSTQGFVLVGWAIRKERAYVCELRLLYPDAGFATSPHERQALVLPPLTAAWLADRVAGELAEVWESAGDRLIVWGECIPDARRHHSKNAKCASECNQKNVD